MARLGASKKKKSPRVTELSQLKKELQRVTEEQTATSEILRLIATLSTDIQSVLDTIAENAARLCDAKDALIFRVDGDVHRRVAVYGTMPTPAVGMRGPNTRGTPVGRAIIDRQTIHVHDIAVELDKEYPEYKILQQAIGTRTVLSTPLLRDGVPLGVILIRRTAVDPFTDEQIALLKTFADQAVIAIENVRLFRELGERNAELREALERQTATSEVLDVIASSPTDIQPVLDVVAENAARLCDAQDAQIYRVENDMMQKVARYGTVPDGIPVGETRRVSRGSNSGRAIVERQPIHIHDMLLEREEDFPDVWAAVQHGVFGQRWLFRCCAKAFLSGPS